MKKLNPCGISWPKFGFATFGFICVGIGVLIGRYLFTPSGSVPDGGSTKEVARLRVQIKNLKAELKLERERESGTGKFCNNQTAFQLLIYN